MNEKFLSYEIEFDWNDPVGEHRCLYWRIKPSQLNWFERLFKNPWRQLYHECFGEWNRYFSSTRFYEEIKPCKTAGDILSYIMKQGELIDKHNTRPSHGWPINLNE